MKNKLILFLGLILVFVAIAFFVLNKNNKEVLSPLIKNNNGTNSTKKEYKVFGFLPTWMVGKTVNYTNEVNNLIFLGVEANEQGDLIWDSQSKKINSDVYLKQKESIKKAGGKNILGIKLFNDGKLIQLMSSEMAKGNLIKQIKREIIDGGFDGVNLDFEYQNSPTSVAGDDFFAFLSSLKKEGVGEISIDVFANTILRSDMDNLKRLVNESDNLIVMAYDFHRSGSENAGPVAPIRAPAGERNIDEVAQRVIDLGLDNNKIILAYPLYGYEWTTETSEFGSLTKNSEVALASYKRMKELLSDTAFVKTSAVKWDEESMTPWLFYNENGNIKQIYFENLRSISEKLKLVVGYQFGGVGFWALGYEGENKDIWELTKSL